MTELENKLVEKILEKEEFVDRIIEKVAELIVQKKFSDSPSNSSLSIQEVLNPTGTTYGIKVFDNRSLANNSFVYVVTKHEEYNTYVEEVFLDDTKAIKYCKQFEGKENECVRNITTVKVTL